METNRNYCQKYVFKQRHTCTICDHMLPSLKFHLNVTFTWNIACSERWSFLYFSHSVMVDTKPLQSGQSDSLPSRVVQRYSFVAVSKQVPLRTVMVHTLLRVCSLQIYIHEKSFYRLNVDSTILKETRASVWKTGELHRPFSRSWD